MVLLTWLSAGADGRVQGCYLHGLFSSDAFRAAYLASLRPGRESGPAWEDEVERTLDALAEHLWHPAGFHSGAASARNRLTAPIRPPGSWKAPSNCEAANAQASCEECTPSACQIITYDKVDYGGRRSSNPQPSVRQYALRAVRRCRQMS